LITDELLLKNIFPRVYACAARAAQPTPVFETAETKEFEDDFRKWVAKVKPHMDRLSNDNVDFYLGTGFFYKIFNLIVFLQKSENSATGW